MVVLNRGEGVENICLLLGSITRRNFELFCISLDSVFDGHFYVFSMAMVIVGTSIGNRNDDVRREKTE